MTIRSRIAVLAGLAALLPAAASAEPKPAPTASTEAAPTRADLTRRPPRYCIITERTGSRIRHKECATRAQWLKEGFDPLAPR